MNSNPPAPAIKVYLVEDYAPIRARLAQLVCAVARAQIVGEADEPTAALAGIGVSKPHVVIVDLQLKSGTSGLTVLKWLRAHEPDIAAIVLSNSAYAQMRQVCLDLGASLVLDKAGEFVRIGDAVREAADRARRAD
jgi:DNA-binding NarL/FixJ family response regulator